MGTVNNDLLLYSAKIMRQYAEDHSSDVGESGRLVNAIKIIEPLLDKINNLE